MKNIIALRFVFLFALFSILVSPLQSVLLESAFAAEAPAVEEAATGEATEEAATEEATEEAATETPEKKKDGEEPDC